MNIHRVMLGIALVVSTTRVSAQPVPIYKKESAPLDARVEDLLKRMSLEEKVAQMEAIAPGRALDSLLNGGDTVQYGASGHRLSFGAMTGAPRGAPRQRAEAINRIQKYFAEQTRLGIPIIITDEALHGVVGQGFTNYPGALAFSSTWDVALVNEAFTQVALEAALTGTNLVLAPVLDLAQDPRWGRVEETYGEDPYLNARMGVASITGFQGTSWPLIDRRHVAATTKHFAGHGAPEGGRNIGPVHMSEHELRELHLVPFEAAVSEAHAMAVMPAYHEVLGMPVHANPYMLTDILRNEWKFAGITVSDFFGVRYNFDTHRVAKDSASAAALAAMAGVDIDMPQLASYRNLVALVRSGRLKESIIDRAVRRVLRAKFALGLFDSPYVDASESERIVAQPTHLATARRVGGEAITLLKNDGSILPLDPARAKTVAVIGPHADFAEPGNYAGTPATRVTALTAVRERLAATGGRVIFAEGVRLLDQNRGGLNVAAGPVGRGGQTRITPDSINQRLIREAVDSAKQADVVVLMLGATARMMHEAWGGNDGDNDDLELRGMQNDLADAIKATGKPVIVMLFSGGPLSFAHIDATMPAILYCWYLGQETGRAVADVLFGDVNPSGHLPLSIARSVGQIPVYYNHQPSARRSNYLFDDSSPLYSFGYGLSYTTFRMDSVQLTRNTISRKDSVFVSTRVTNTGTRAGAAVVQLYVRQDYTLPARPVKELKEFQRVSLQPGESRTIRMLLTPAKLAHVGVDKRWVVDAGTVKVMVGSSSRDSDLTVVPLTVR
jgi:beta-glucosidase